jgi:hypothetical protein
MYPMRIQARGGSLVVQRNLSTIAAPMLQNIPAMKGARMMN